MNINCDMGEGMNNEALIMPYIDSANISCGLHAGDEKTIRETIELASRHRVSIGAHPSFDDRPNFGRLAMKLPAREIYELLLRQLKILHDMTSGCDERLQHVKPHGALYNMSADNQFIAAVIATAVRDFDPGLTLIGLSGSYSIREAEAAGLKTAREGFADRRYQNDGSLLARTEPGAMITDVREAVQQALSLSEGKVLTIAGEYIPMPVETLCIHGDGADAVVFAKAIHEALRVH